MENILDPSQLSSLNTPESKPVLDSSQVQFADSFLNTPTNTQTFSEVPLPFDSDELLSTVLSGGPAVGMDHSWEDLEREIANGFGGNNNGDPFSQQIQQAIHSHLTNSNSKSEDQWNQQSHHDTQQDKQYKDIQNRLNQAQQANSETTKTYPSFDEYSRFNTTPTNSTSTPTDTSYDEAVRMWAQQRGINLESRKRKSEDITDNFAHALNMKHHDTDLDFGVGRRDHNYTITTAPPPAQAPPGRAIDRRNSMPAAPPTHTSSYGSNAFSTTTSTFSPPSALNAAQAPKPGDLDVPAGKSQLLDMVCGEKEMLSYCTKVLNYICTQLKVRVGGFYVNQRSSIKDWLLYYAYPSSHVFSQFFQLNVGYNLLIQASAEKRCFCVHSTNLSPSSLSFMFVPIPVDDSQNALGVMVLGTVLGQEDEMHGQLLFLDQIRKTIAASMNSILALQQNNAMVRKLDYLKLENEVLKQKNRFERALIGIISSSSPNQTADSNQLRSDTAIICCDTMGVITYFSPSSQALLGYQPNEIVGRYSPLKFHDPNEIIERAKEVEQETGKKISVGWSVIIEKTLRNGGVEDVREWNYIKKDGVSIRVNLSIKPLYDDEDQSIIGFLALARPLNQ